MDTKIKKSKLLIFTILIIAIITGIAVGIFYSMGGFVNRKPLYGTFEYKNEDGSIAKVVLTETTVYCENVNYDAIMVNASWYMVKDDLAATPEKENIDMDEFGRLQEEYRKGWDFKSAFDGKTSKIDYMKYIEEYNQYYYYVNYPPTGSHGLDICVDLETQTLIMADVELNYVG